MHSIKRSLALLLLAASLVFPTGALAASTGTVNETATATTSVALVVPPSIVYPVVDKVASGTIALTGIEATFITSATLQVSPNSNGSSALDYTKRAIDMPVNSAGWTFTDIAVGGWTSAVGKIIATRSTDVTDGTIDVASSILISSAGTFTGTLQFTLQGS